MIAIQHESGRALVIKDSHFHINGGVTYKALADAGKLYVDNEGGRWCRYELRPGQKAWMRQVNPEYSGRKVLNDGADLWVLGVKTEWDGTVVETRSGGRTEVFGGYQLANTAVPATQPMWINDGGHVSLSYVEATYTATRNWNIHVQETRDGNTGTLTRNQVPRFGYGSLVALYTGYTERGGGTTPRPDLVVTDVSWRPAAPIGGRGVTFSATIKNQGFAATPADVTHGVGFFVDGVKVSWSGHSSAALAPGQSRTVVANGGGANGWATWTAVAGAHIVEAYVDDVDRMAESDEANNKLGERLTVAGASSAAARQSVGDGLSAAYFNGADFAQASRLQGACVSRIEPEINFNWGVGSPDPAVGADTFAARFAGKIDITADGTYTFRVTRDNGVRLWVDGRLVINRWTDTWSGQPGGAPDTAGVSLAGGRRYDLRLEYFENRGGAAVKLEWNRPEMDAGTFEVVSQRYLYSGTKNFPPAAVVNVKDYGARGDGLADDTAAINRAIQNNLGSGNTLYFPAGTYLVGDRLEWRTAGGLWWCFLAFQGQNEGNTIIKLKDASIGYGDPARPRSVVRTASLNAAQPEGADNDAYRNHIQDLTVDTGRDNPGAIGIDWVSTNEGGMRHVTVRSGDGRGVFGLNLGIRDAAGPNYAKHLTVEGFDYGIDASEFYSAGTTLEHVVLRRQNVAGLRAEDLSLSIRDLRSVNHVPAVRAARGSLVVLLDADFKFTGTTPTEVDAIEIGVDESIVHGDGAVYGRNLKTAGYDYVVNKGGADLVAGGFIREWASNGSTSLFGPPSSSLGLPVQEAPELHENDLSKWANIADYGARRDDYLDDSAAIQAAVDSGATTVFFPVEKGRVVTTGDTINYQIDRPVVVRGDVRRIWGGNFNITQAGANRTFSDPTNPQAYFRIEDTNSDDVTLEKMKIQNWVSDANFAGAIFVDHASPKKLVLRDFAVELTDDARYKQTYRNAYGPGVGDLFLEGVSANKFVFTDGQNVWAGMLNAEGTPMTPKVLNDGATLWVLGCKTEDATTFIETTGGGRTELLGGMVWHGAAAPNPALINRESSVSFVGQFPEYADERKTPVLVAETRGGATRTLTFADAPRQHFGNVLTLYTGY